jgi:hypothetical protein
VSLRVTASNPTLDRKLKLLGFEVLDLVVLFIFLSILNMIFGEGQKLLGVWLPTILIALVLRVGKHGKPDKYLIHLIKYHRSPGIYSAFKSPTHQEWPPRVRREQKNV